MFSSDKLLLVETVGVDMPVFVCVFMAHVQWWWTVPNLMMFPVFDVQCPCLVRGKWLLVVKAAELAGRAHEGLLSAH